MSCYDPIKAFLPFDLDFEGKRHLIFSKRKIYEFKRATVLKLIKSGFLPSVDYSSNFDYLYDETRYFPEIYFSNDISDYPDGLLIDIPCGKCIGCKFDYSKRWATRAINEAFLHDHYKNCAFLSLTFNQDQLFLSDHKYSVSKIFFRSWLKRFRAMIYDYYKVRIRFLGCGEYGSKNLRPHYHLLVFGFNFPDKYIFKQELRNGEIVNYFRSPFLEKCWSAAHSFQPYGFSLIGSVNYKSCAYVARYILKKNDLKIGSREKPFLTASRMPGLGHDFCSCFLTDIFKSGHVTLPDGTQNPIPRYYESICQKINPELFYNYKFDQLNSLHESLLLKFKKSGLENSKRRDDLKFLQNLKNERLLRIIK